jgi:hypothetical protein
MTKPTANCSIEPVKTIRLLWPCCLMSSEPALACLGL